MNNKILGNKGEEYTARYLMTRGYEILERNYLIKGSEIDIIARKNNEIHFVEVKTRTQDIYGSPAEAVDYYKRKALIHGAKYYLMKHFEFAHMICSFDISEVYIKHRLLFNKKIKYIENAFELE